MGSRSSQSWTSLIAVVGVLIFGTPATAQESQDPSATTPPTAPAAPSDAPDDAIAIQRLDADLIERFLLVLKSVQALPTSADGSDEFASSPSGEIFEQSRPTPFTTMVFSASARAAIDPIARSNGFADAKEWARAGDRLALLIGIVDVIEGSDVIKSEIEATKKSFAQIRAALGNDAPVVPAEDGAP